ncbi:MAG: type II secretion system protein [Planctomycetes bacterium]|nr:type II secretion system protein [Planctomycetota bacterium]
MKKYAGLENRAGRPWQVGSGGFTLVELMVVIAVLAIIMAMALPSLFNARMAGNEASAIGSLRTLVSVNSTYKTRFQSYATSLGSLQTTGYIDDVLASGSKSGYTFTYTGAVDTFSITGDPISPGSSGSRYFFTDESGVIRFSSTGTATATSSAVD